MVSLSTTCFTRAYYFYPVLSDSNPWSIGDQIGFRDYAKQTGYSQAIFDGWDREYSGWETKLLTVYQYGYVWYVETDLDTVPNDLNEYRIRMEGEKYRFQKLWEEPNFDEITSENTAGGIRNNIRRRWEFHREILEIATEIKQELEHRITELT